MNPITLDTPREILSFRLHEQARRHRARVISALFARLIERLASVRLAQIPVARWG